MMTFMKKLKETQRKGLLVGAMTGTAMLVIIMGKLERLEGYSLFTVGPVLVVLACLWGLALRRGVKE